VLKRILHRLRVFWRVLRHRETPWYVKAMVVLALLYAVWPLDVITALAPLLGWSDDLAVVSGLLLLAWRLTPERVKREAEHGKDPDAPPPPGSSDAPERTS